MSDVNLKLEKHEISRAVAMKYGKTVVDDAIIVPDIKPDVKRILCVSSSAYITGITPSQDKVSVEGVAKATVLYIPDGDVIGSVKVLNMSREFSHSMDVKGADPDSIISAEAEISKTSATLINSRKINIRISIDLGLRISSLDTIEIPCGIDSSAPEPPKKPDFLDRLPFSPRMTRQPAPEAAAPSSSDDIQFRMQPIRIADNQINTDGSVIVRDQYEISSKLPPVGEILLANVCVEPEDAVITEGNIRLKGSLKISVIYEDSTGEGDESGKIRVAEFNTPYSEQFDAPNATDDMECDTEYTVREVYTEIRDNKDGEAKIIGVETVAGVNIAAYSLSEPQAITDAYALGNDELRIERSEISPEQIIDIKTSEITHKTTAKRTGDQPEITGVCCAKIIRTSVDDIKFENGAAAVKGSVDMKIMCLTGDENRPIIAIDHTAKFEDTLECAEFSGSRTACDAKISVSHCGYNISGSDAVDLRLIIGISLKLIKNDKIQIIKSIERCEGEAKDSCGMHSFIIYIVQSGDTLWNIAKRYHTTVDDIVKNNNIQDRDLIMPGQKIKIYA